MSELDKIDERIKNDFKNVPNLEMAVSNSQTVFAITAELAAQELAALRAERDEAVRLLAKHGIPYEAIRADYGSKKWIAENVWSLIEETTNEIRAFLSKIEERK